VETHLFCKVRDLVMIDGSRMLLSGIQKEEELADTFKLFLLDHQLCTTQQLAPRLPLNHHPLRFAVGHDSLFETTMFGVRRYELDCVTLTAEFDAGVFKDLTDLALASQNRLVVMERGGESTDDPIHVFNAHSLARSFSFGRSPFHHPWHMRSGLAVVGEQVFVGNTVAKCLHVFSLANGAHLRDIRYPGGFERPCRLLSTGDRLYMTDILKQNAHGFEDPPGRLFVLTPDGSVVHVYSEPALGLPWETPRYWLRTLTLVQGKLLVGMGSKSYYASESESVKKPFAYVLMEIMGAT